MLTRLLLFQCCFLLVTGLQLTSSPPLLDMPTYALATFNKDGTTNMNILTYATPVSAQPQRVWSLGVYRETLTEENLQRKPGGVLQLLTKDHIDLVSILGGSSGRDVNKEEECAKAGFEWIDGEYFDGIQVLPGCASYICFTVQGGMIDAGSHLIVPYCQVEAMYTTSGDNIQSSDHLRTGRLRELGIITEQGRVASVQRSLDNRGFRLE